MEFCILSHGHPNVSATHKSTIEITCEGFLNTTGDCIIGIRADKSLKDLPVGLKDFLRRGKKVRVTFECGGIKDSLMARGDPRLTLDDPKSLIIRKSDYACGRTLCVRADKAAIDLDRKLIENIKEGGALKMIIEALSAP